jgi:hypothetical protein
MSFNLIIKNQSRKVGDMPVSYSPSEKQDYRSNLSVNKIVICPEQTGAVKDCQSCKLCSNPKRKSIVGFLKH